MDELKTKIEIYMKRRALAGKMPVRRRELVNRFWKFYGVNKLSAALVDLEASGLLVSTEERGRDDGRGGQMRRQYDLA